MCGFLVCMFWDFFSLQQCMPDSNYFSSLKSYHWSHTATLMFSYNGQNYKMVALDVAMHENIFSFNIGA